MRFLRMSYLAAVVGAFGFFALSVLLLGVWPGQVLEEQIQRESPEHPLALTASELRGRAIYSREGCAYCHTQQIRYLDQDMQRFGAPTLAWETRFDYPHLWGTRRIGPDLSRETGTRREDWQLAHLYAPRSVVTDSVMPAYAALFDGTAGKPKQDARDVIAYLESLGRGRQLAGPEGEARAMKACASCDEMQMMAFHAKELNASPAKARRTGGFPPIEPGVETARGRELFAHNCAGCHGAKGEGDGPAAKALRPVPANLSVHEYSSARLAFLLWNGYAGSAMPAWRDVNETDRQAVAATVRAFHATKPEPQIPEATLAVGAQVYKERCAQCHGETGAGDGSAVKEIEMVPTNFHLQQPDIAEALKALREGVEGSPMAPWSGKLSEGELNAVAFYVRTLYGSSK